MTVSRWIAMILLNVKVEESHHWDFIVQTSIIKPYVCIIHMQTNGTKNTYTRTMSSFDATNLQSQFPSLVNSGMSVCLNGKSSNPNTIWIRAVSFCKDVWFSWCSVSGLLCLCSRQVMNKNEDESFDSDLTFRHLLFTWKMKL